MPVFIDARGHSLEQVDAAAKANSNNGELLEHHIAFTHNKVFIIGEPESSLAPGEARKFIAAKYPWVSPDEFTGELPNHLKD